MVQELLRYQPVEEALFRYRPGLRLPGQSFSRSSSGVLRSRQEELVEVGTDVLRDGHWVEDENGDLVRATRLEAARTNELHNSDSPATQTRNLTAGTYTLWMEGSGSVDASGATDGSYGTATESTTNENDLTFTVSAQQDVTFTVNNSVDRFQCEEGAFRSSFIATQGSAVSRAADVRSEPISFGPQAFTVYGKAVARWLKDSGQMYLVANIGSDRVSTNNRFTIRRHSSNDLQVQFRNEDLGSETDASERDPDYGEVFEYRAVLEADGSIEAGVSIEGDAETTTTGSAITIPDSWTSDKIILTNDVVLPALDHIIGPTVWPGKQSLASARSLAART